MRFRRLFSIFFIYFLLVAPHAWSMEDAILAVVNDEVITVKDLKEYLQGILAQLKVEGKTQAEAQETIQQYQAKGVEQLIDDRLILSAANKMGMLIRPEAIDQRLDEIKKRYKSYDEFLDTIKREGLTVTEIRKKLENQIKGQIVVNNEVRAKVYVNPQEVTDYFNTHKEEFTTTSRVFLNTVFVNSEAGRESAHKKIAEARKKIKQGVGFMLVVQDFSDLPSVGEVTEEQLRPEFKKQLDKMIVGDVSGVVEVPEGFYIIKLEGRKPGTTAVLKDVNDAIYQKLFEDKFRERFKAWIEKLRKKAYVEIKS
ncbi:MAG: peptidyl-prolyl cis-trans isomerase [Candidatus Omnitrophica bacterium]|nr:peptidyl-prolyl cis-trans isomerase [Candidatus Omnitrophota bacterium]